MDLIIHHWDTDGVVSAVILTKVLRNKFYYFTPSPGNYFLSKKEREEIKNFKSNNIYLLDMSLPEADLKFLDSISNFEVFDHHTGEKVNKINMHNPVLDGESQKKYPSCSSVIKDYYNLEEDILIWAGIWGDFGFKLDKEDKMYKNLTEYLAKVDFSFKEFKLLVSTIDYQYKTGEKERIYRVIKFLLNNNVRKIIDKKKFVNVISEIENEKMKQIRKFKEYGQMEFLFLNNPYYIISDLCRMQYKKTPEKYNIVLGYRDGFYNFYLRTGKEDLSPIVEKTRKQGYFAGGKNDVLGVVFKENDLKKFIKFVQDCFFKKRGLNLNKVINSRKEN